MPLSAAQYHIHRNIAQTLTEYIAQDILSETISPQTEQKNNYSFRFCRQAKPHACMYTNIVCLATVSANKLQDGRFKCLFCEKTFADRYSHRHHVRVIHEKRHLYNCILCGQGFNKKAQLEKHTEAYRDTGKCPDPGDRQRKSRQGFGSHIHV